MNESKSFASLGPTLLARKGAAKPAMRSQHWSQGAANAAQAAETLEDLGWNDMGDEPEVEHSATVLSLTPAQPSNEDDIDEDEEYETQPLIAGNDIDEVHAVEQVDETSEEAEDEDEDASHYLPDDYDTDDFEDENDDDYGEDADAALAQWVTRKPEVRRQQEELAEAVGATEEAAPTPRKRRSSRERGSALDKGQRAAFTLRLDAERHLKLRLACTIRNRSAQQLVTEALDRFLGQIQEVEALAAQLKK